MPWMGQLIETCCVACCRRRGIAGAEQENNHQSFTPLEGGNTPTDATRAGTEIKSSSSKKLQELGPIRDFSKSCRVESGVEPSSRQSAFNPSALHEA